MRSEAGGIVRAHRADVDTDVAGPRARGRHRVPLEELPGGLQQQPLLGLHGAGLPGADPEELGVEVLDAVDEPTLVGIAASDGVRVRVVEVAPVPPRRERTDRVDLVAEQLPEVLHGGDASR